MDLYTNHKPRFITITNKEGRLVPAYYKTEMDDNFLFLKDNSISINAEILEKVEHIIINIPHRNVVLSIDKSTVKAHKLLRTFLKEVKYYMPIEKFRVEYGDMMWVRRILEDKQSNTLVLPKKKKQRT